LAKHPHFTHHPAKRRTVGASFQGTIPCHIRAITPPSRQASELRGEHFPATTGILLHIDGSRHQWLQDERWYDLIVILDDATSEIYCAQLVEEEVIERKSRKVRGIPLSRSPGDGWLNC
jgi:hypothetical protein